MTATGIARGIRPFMAGRVAWARRLYLGAFAVVLVAAWWHLGTSDVAQAADVGRVRVAILGAHDDSRVPPVREAVAYWNGELARLGLRMRLDSGTMVRGAVPEEALRASSRAKLKPWSPVVDARLRAALSNVPGEIVIVLSGTDLISFGLPIGTDRKGVVAIRRADVLPLSLPNTVRNVVAHELGHVLGLEHNADSTTLMCGRPAPCRPSAFAADDARFFPLTTEDERTLRHRWQ